MTRVSLKEAYDNKDVIAQIYAIRDTAESAVDTSEQAVTTANTASDHVDALVPQVEQAVVDANTASASAQASAQTVAGYENRLTVAEGAIDELESDVNDVTLRVTTAEGDIVTIQGRMTALETADGQNVKLTGNHAIGNYALLLSGNQIVSGDKVYTNPLVKRIPESRETPTIGASRAFLNLLDNSENALVLSSFLIRWTISGSNEVVRLLWRYTYPDGTNQDTIIAEIPFVRG